MLEMNAFAYCVPLLDICVIISLMIDAGYCLLEVEMDVSLKC